MKTNKLLRADARQSLKDVWADAVLATLIFVVIACLWSSLSQVGSLFQIYAVASLSLLLSFFLIMPLSGGFSVSFLRFLRGDNNASANMFRSFRENYGKFLGGLLIVGAITIALLIPFFIVYFIVIFASIGSLDPAIIAAADEPDLPIELVATMIPLLLLYMIPILLVVYRYQLFMYVLEDNPEMGIMDSLQESKRLTRGHIWKLFGLDLSFIGWYLLSLLTLGVGMLWVIPYQYTARAAFYQDRINEDKRQDAEYADEVKAQVEDPVRPTEE